MDLSNIVYCKIYPGIGIARVGDSPDDIFIGPESPGRGPGTQTFKDAKGRIKRQAARFRIYGYDASHNVVAELTPSDLTGVHIEWHVELSNKKASNDVFGRRKAPHDSTPNLRNATVTDRASLEIVPSGRSISGCANGGPPYAFDDGLFLGHPVYLGELRTDQQGRLLVLGGRGASGSVGVAQPITDFANNDGWYDDTSDGPVRAKVTIGGKDLPVTSSWVIVAPPKFAPFIPNIVSLYDTMAEAMSVNVHGGDVSFMRDIYPTLSAMADLQWTNAMALRGHGPQKPGNFHDPEILKLLSNPSSENAPFRQRVFDRLRNPNVKSEEQANYNFMPILSGDEGDVTVGKPGTWLSLLPSTYERFERWKNGEFIGDWVPGRELETPPPLDKLPLGEQPAALDRASLELCVGGPFFPGIEVTYVAREAERYSEPFRFDDNQAPGEMTRRMAVPWQADFYECSVHWWPAQRPDDVLNEQQLRHAIAAFPDDAQAGRLARVATERQAWDRGVGAHWVNPEERDESESEPKPKPESESESEPEPGDNDMVTKWKTLGFVVPFTTPAGERFQVETGRSQYDGLGDRDYFYYLLNIDSYPDFLPKAQQLAEQFIEGATRAMDDPKSYDLDSWYQYFPYTSDSLDQRLDEIYALYQAESTKDPTASPDNVFRTREDMIERIRQFAPLNQLDGAWVRNIAPPGPIDEVNALLFSVWMDEVGEGSPEMNHANVYTNLLETLGIHLPPISTRDYANNPDLLDSAYTVPMYELAISQFTDRFFPEILGMTLQLEWEVMALWPTVKLLRHFNIDSHFYELHIGIDNASNGHGAKARLAVHRFLDEARRRGGDAEVQTLWRRIWSGYVAFGITGTLAHDLRKLMINRQKHPQTLENKVDAILLAKKKYGSLNHGEKRLNSQFINDLFEDPPAFRKALVDAGYVVPGHPEQSSFFRYTSFSGPMFKVFTDEELDIWKAWVVSLRKDDAPVKKDPCALMVACVEHFRRMQEGTPAHDRHRLIGDDPESPGSVISLSVTEWFSKSARALMAALANPENKLITAGNSTRSSLVTAILAGNNAMVKAFDAAVPDSGGKTWKQVVIDWIDAGCPLPSVQQPQRLSSAIVPAARLSLTSPIGDVEQHPRRRRVAGMGVVH